MSKYRLSQPLRKNGIWERLKPVLIEEGISEYQIIYTGKHPCVEFVCNSQRGRYYFALTPGTLSSWRPAVGGLRRKIREMKNA